jgi:multicopper oxidase
VLTTAQTASPLGDPPRRRRRPLTLVALLAAVLLVVWAVAARPWQDDAPASGALQTVSVQDDAVVAAEAARRGPNAAVRDVTLTAAPTTLALGDRTVETWAFGGTVPGPELRLTAGEVLRARVVNDLPEPLTVHWHGIALRADMDGVPDVTQEAIAPGASFTYEFTVPDPGTYFYHSHSGVQLDRGLYGALVVADPAEPGPAADVDVPVLLDDWLDGTGTDPDRVLDDLTGGDAAQGMGMAGHDMSGMEMGEPSPDAPLGTDTGDVAYPLLLANGRPATAPQEVAVAPGARVRLRLVNAGADTPFRVAVAGSALTVVATDGFPVQPFETDTLIIAMGERYDVLVTAPASGAVPVVAVPEGRQGQALVVLRAGPGPAPDPLAAPAELTGRLLSLADLRPAAAVQLAARPPDRTYRVELTGDMAAYDWRIKAPAPDGTTLPVREGERIRLEIRNTSMMWHPVHLHGHTFQVVGEDGAPGPRKDTVIVPANGSVTVELDADNPGQWALHCHNIYHAEAGMVTVLSYVR